MNGLTIVMYHYIRDLKTSRYSGIKGLDVHLFKEQIDYIRKHYNVVTMEEVIYCIDNKKYIPDKSILLTFDDAYTDHYVNVFPILDKYKIQGSFFVPAKAITEGVVLDVNKIHFILASFDNKVKILKDLRILFNQYKDQYKLDSFDDYYKKLAHASRYDTKEVIFIKRLLQFELPETLRMKILDNLFEKYMKMSESAFSRELYMNIDQLGCMLSNGMHIGNHGYNHYWWNRLNEDDMAQELNLSLKFLTDLGVDMNNWTACYPYGSYDEQSIRMLNERGCKLAVTTEVGLADISKLNRYMLPRLDTNDIPKDGLSNPNEWYLKA
jgi:peptidoglycan/xylan/chitin deacetylase (PgdA/CDA1 family)